MTRQMQHSTLPETGFRAVKRLTPREWLNHDTECRSGEYIHAVPHDGRLVLYRAFRESGSSDRLVTVLPNARVRLNDYLNPVHEVNGRAVFEKRQAGQTDRFDTDRDVIPPDEWYLTGSEAQTFMAFVDLASRQRGDPVVTAEWYGDAGMPMTAGQETVVEALHLRYRTDGGSEGEVVINSAYQHKSQMLARWRD